MHTCSSSESVTAEAVLHRRVWQNHVGVTEHAQSIQAERFNAELILQGEDPFRIETLGHGGQHAADILRQVRT